MCCQNTFITGQNQEQTNIRKTKQIKPTLNFLYPGNILNSLTHPWDKKYTRPNICREVWFEI